MGKPTIRIGKKQSFAVTAKLISAFVFATRIVQIQKFQSLTTFCDCTARFVSDLVGTQVVGFLMHRLSFECRSDIQVKHVQK